MRKVLDLENQILTAIYGVDLKLRNARKIESWLIQKTEALGKISKNKIGSDLRAIIANDLADGFDGEEDTAVMRRKALDAVNTFKTIKKAIW